MNSLRIISAVLLQVKIWFQNRRMKFKKVNTGCFDGSPDMMIKPEDAFHPMSPEAVMFRHGVDPCNMLDSSAKPLDLVTSAAKTEMHYPYYASAAQTPAPITANHMGVSDLVRTFHYQPPYFNHLPSASVGLDTLGQHRQASVQENLSMHSAAASTVAHYQQKYSNNNTGMPYHTPQYNTHYSFSPN